MRFWMELWMEEGNLQTLGGSGGPNPTAGEKRKMIFRFLFFLKKKACYTVHLDHVKTPQCSPSQSRGAADG